MQWEQDVCQGKERVCVKIEGASCYSHNIWSCDPNRTIALFLSFYPPVPPLILQLWDKKGRSLNTPSLIDQNDTRPVCETPIHQWKIKLKGEKGGDLFMESDANVGNYKI